MTESKCEVIARACKTIARSSEVIARSSEMIATGLQGDRDDSRKKLPVD